MYLPAVYCPGETVPFVNFTSNLDGAATPVSYRWTLTGATNTQISRPPRPGVATDPPLLPDVEGDDHIAPFTAENTSTAGSIDGTFTVVASIAKTAIAGGGHIGLAACETPAANVLEIDISVEPTP